MTVRERGAPVHLSQRERLLAVALYVLTLLLVSRAVCGEFIPRDSGQRLWLLSGIGLWFFVLISAPWYRPPRDALVTAFTAVLLLSFLDLSGVALLRAELSVFRWLAIGVASLAAASAAAAIALREVDPIARPRLAYVSRLSFQLGDALGRGEIVFTPPALISIVGYYQSVPAQQLWLLLAWVFLVSVRPIELALRTLSQVRTIAASTGSAELIGVINRVDNPNILRVSLHNESLWTPDSVAVACLPNSEQVCVLPLFRHVQESQLVGTGLYHGCPDRLLPAAMPGNVYRPSHPIDAGEIVSTLSGIDGARLVGFVVEDASIGAIRFEVAPDSDLDEGMIVFCRQRGASVYYQILDARTAEESFERNPRGKHIAAAAQLGCLDAQKGFVKYGWLPPMNAPVFLPMAPVTPGPAEVPADEFELGRVPGSALPVRAGFRDLVEFHAAILGATGTGKTELALDLVRHGLAMGTKVFCVDFTGEYEARLASSRPVSLGLEEGAAQELNEKLFAVDTGTFGAKEEKAALKEFLDQTREPVMQRVAKFLESEGGSLGIFELSEIANTKATLRATELYLSSIMDWARRHRRARRILIVLEEAHTVIPETAWAGFDADTQWVVGRIAQIALQGRKYGVGLLVISQRTALVSKSILSQCNTHVTFSLVDRTSLEYLANVYSPDHVRAIPNLGFLQAMAYGKAVRSERPVLFQIEYAPEKKDACDALNVALAGPSGPEG